MVVTTNEIDDHGEFWLAVDMILTRTPNAVFGGQFADYLSGESFMFPERIVIGITDSPQLIDVDVSDATFTDTELGAKFHDIVGLINGIPINIQVYDKIPYWEMLFETRWEKRRLLCSSNIRSWSIPDYPTNNNVNIITKPYIYEMQNIHNV